MENEFEVEFKVGEEVEIKLEYEEEFEVNLTEREVELEYEVEFDSILEFIDANNNGLYDKGEEVSVYELDGAEFTPINYTTEVTLNNVTEHVITTQTTDGIFKVTLHVVGDFANIEGEVVRPTEIKIDLEINNYNYTNETSKLALKVKIESVMETEEEKKVGDVIEKVEIKSGNYTGFFSWEKEVLVDKVEKPVLSTSLAEDPEEASKELYLIYERGNSIAHDPKIGIVTELIPTIATPDFTFLYLAIVGIVVVGIIVVIHYESLKISTG